MQNKSAPKYRGDSAKSLGDIAHTIINIKVGTFTINPTRVNKLPKPLNEIPHLETLFNMLRQRVTEIMLVVANYVPNKVHYLLVLFRYLLQ
jgi:hypothetical protein